MDEGWKVTIGKKSGHLCSRQCVHAWLEEQMDEA